MNHLIDRVENKLTNGSSNNPEFFDDIINSSWTEIEKFIGFKLSKREINHIKHHYTTQDLENHWKSLNQLSEAKGYFKRSQTDGDLNAIIEKISRAIRNRHYCGVFYQHENGERGFRLTEPYLVGQGYVHQGNVSREHENDYYLRCFVIKDSVKDKSVRIKRSKSVSVSNNLPYWRLMRVDRIVSWVTIQRKFSYYREGYTGGTDKNIRSRIEWVPISSFIRQNPY